MVCLDVLGCDMLGPRKAEVAILTTQVPKAVESLT